jgi:hypothetical protein
MKRGNLAFVAAVILVLALVGNAQAGLTRVVANVFTTNYTDPAQRQLSVFINVYDNHNYRGPDFVSSIRVYAPDGSEFAIHRSKDWLQYDRGYFKALYAADFSSRAIPTGTYRITVTPLVGSAITETDTLTASFLAPPTITFPANGALGVVEMPTIRWNAVAGATNYRIYLWNNSWNEPVFWSWDKQIIADFTSFTVPRGELKPNCQYRLRIEARSDSLDLDRRSRSDYFTFTTGNW